MRIFAIPVFLLLILLLQGCTLSNNHSPVGPYVPFDERYEELVLPEIDARVPIVRIHRFGVQGENPPIRHIDISLGSRHFRLDIETNRLTVAEGHHLLLKDREIVPEPIEIDARDVCESRQPGTVPGWLNVVNSRSINKAG